MINTKSQEWHENFVNRVSPLLDMAKAEDDKRIIESIDTDHVCHICKTEGKTTPYSWSVKGERGKDRADLVDLLCEYHKVYWEEAMRIMVPERLANFDITPLFPTVIV